MLTNVTLTGADDSVDPENMIRLSEKYPFVEWGILVGSNSETPRFPSHRWLRELADKVASSGVVVKLSLHICGGILRGMLDRAELDIHPAISECDWQRSQLNFHGHALTLEQERNCILSMQHDWIAEEIIVQLDGINDAFLDRLIDDNFTPVSGFYDRSHGAGVIPGEWPTANPNWSVGYAGGLGPENVLSEVANIRKATSGQRFWIDMETKLRYMNEHTMTDSFCLYRCGRVLEILADQIGH